MAVAPEYPTDPADKPIRVRSAWPRFAMLPAALAGDAAVSPPVKAVLLALASYAGGDHRCWPSVASLAEDTGLGRSTVQRCLRTAEEAGYLERLLPNDREQNDGRTTTTYRLLGGLTSGAEGPQEEGGGAPLAGRGGAPGAGPKQDQGNRTREQDQGTGSGTDVPERPAPPETPGRIAASVLCDALADSVQRRGVRRPTVTQAWLDAARLLVDRDGATPAAVQEVIAWVEHDDFWRANVLSMPKLRERWATLVLQRRRGNRGAGLLERNVSRVRQELGL